MSTRSKQIRHRGLVLAGFVMGAASLVSTMAGCRQTTIAMIESSQPAVGEIDCTLEPRVEYRLTLRLHDRNAHSSSERSAAETQPPPTARARLRTEEAMWQLFRLVHPDGDHPLFDPGRVPWNVEVKPDIVPWSEERIARVFEASAQLAQLKFSSPWPVGDLSLREAVSSSPAGGRVLLQADLEFRTQLPPRTIDPRRGRALRQPVPRSTGWSRMSSLELREVKGRLRLTRTGRSDLIVQWSPPPTARVDPPGG